MAIVSQHDSIDHLLVELAVRDGELAPPNLCFRVVRHNNTEPAEGRVDGIPLSPALLSTTATAAADGAARACDDDLCSVLLGSLEVSFAEGHDGVEERWGNVCESATPVLRVFDRRDDTRGRLVW